MGNLKIKYAVIGAVFNMVLILLLFVNGCLPSKNDTGKIIQTDTVYVNTPYKEVVTKEIIKPVKVLVYKTDTVFRQQIENDTLIAGLEINKNMARIHTLTPSGIPIVHNHKLRGLKKLRIDHTGKLSGKPKKGEKAKKVLKNTTYAAFFVSGIIFERRILKTNNN